MLPNTTFEIIFYTKPACPLCEEAEELLEKAGDHFAFSVRRIDITRDPDTYEKFKHQIPVLRIGDRYDLSGKIDGKELGQKIRALLKTRK